MSMVIVDASVLYEALVHPGPFRERLATVTVGAPHLIDAEVVSVLRTNSHKGAITTDVAERAIDDLLGRRILRYRHRRLLPRVWELRHNVVPYDALYVALAEWLDVPLLTTDAAMARAPGVKACVEVMPLAC